MKSRRPAPWGLDHPQVWRAGIGSHLRLDLRLVLAALLVILAATLLVLHVPFARATSPNVTLLTIDGAIGPAHADYVVRGIACAAKSGSQLVVLQMDTPGGLESSMRAVIKAILTSPVPVASFVGPSGARAASAGTYIMFASHVAAMAPGTNIGAATPVAVGITPPEQELRRAPAGNPRQADDATKKKVDGMWKDLGIDSK